VTDVRIAIRDAAGAALEEGEAVRRHWIWVYQTATSPSAPPRTVEVVAIDRPGNRTVATATPLPGGRASLGLKTALPPRAASSSGCEAVGAANLVNKPVLWRPVGGNRPLLGTA
jgi:hypothetical protein